MANGRAAVPAPHPSPGSGWFTGALVLGMNLVAGILIWSIWKGSGVSGLGPAAVFGLMVGTALFVVGAVRAVLDVRAAHRDPHGRRTRRPARTVSHFEHAVVTPPSATPTARTSARPAAMFRPPVPELPVSERRASELPASEPPVIEPQQGGSHADVVAVDERQPVHPSTFGEPAPAAIEPGAARLPLAGLHGLGATMQARMFDHGLVTQDDVAAIGDDELEDLASDLGTFPGRLAGWVAEARANLAAADPYMRSA